MISQCGIIVRFYRSSNDPFKISPPQSLGLLEGVSRPAISSHGGAISTNPSVQWGNLPVVSGMPRVISLFGTMMIELASISK